MRDKHNMFFWDISSTPTQHTSTYISLLYLRNIQSRFSCMRNQQEVGSSWYYLTGSILCFMDNYVIVYANYNFLCLCISYKGNDIQTPHSSILHLRWILHFVTNQKEREEGWIRWMWRLLNFSLLKIRNQSITLSKTYGIGLSTARCSQHLRSVRLRSDGSTIVIFV